MTKKAGSGSEGTEGKKGKKAPSSTSESSKKKTTRKASTSKKKVSKAKATKKKDTDEAGAEPTESGAAEEAPAVEASAAEAPEVSSTEPVSASTPETQAAEEAADEAAVVAAPAPPPPLADAHVVGEPETIDGVRGILGAMGAWLWSAERRPWTIAVGAAILLVIGLQFGGDESPAAEPAEPEARAPVGEQSLSEEARLQVAAGDPLGAARRLEPEVTRTDRKGGDAHLHAALAHAYAQAGWGADAVPHFEWTARKDPSALKDEDLRDLVLLLGLPGSTPEGVQATLISAGRRSVPILEAAWEDEEAPVLVRRRAGEVLQRLGEDISLVETYRRLLERGACPARKEAVARLAAATDDKAVELLEQVAESGRCGAAEARRALGQ